MYDAGMWQEDKERLAKLSIIPYLLLNLSYVALQHAFSHKMTALPGVPMPKNVRVYPKANAAKLVFKPVSIRSSRS